MMPTCDWPVDYAQCSECSAMPTDQQDQAKIEQMAVDYLDMWTGGSFGTCEVTIRPCRKPCTNWSTYWGGYSVGHQWEPALIDGAWHNIACGSCQSEQCSCSYVPTLDLPGYVESIVEVVIDGVALDPNAYRVDNHNLLVRTDGGSWPDCQDMGEPSGSLSGFGTGPFGTEPFGGSRGSGTTTWEVTYRRGRPVPEHGQMAAGVLACEIAKSLCGDRTCQLPQRFQQINRQGVTITTLEDFNQLEEGRTGIWLIDSWVASIQNAPRRGVVRSPDIASPGHRRTTSVRRG